MKISTVPTQIKQHPITERKIEYRGVFLNKQNIKMAILIHDGTLFSLQYNFYEKLDKYKKSRAAKYDGEDRFFLHGPNHSRLTAFQTYRYHRELVYFTSTKEKGHVVIDWEPYDEYNGNNFRVYWQSTSKTEVELLNRLATLSKAVNWVKDELKKRETIYG